MESTERGAQRMSAQSALAAADASAATPQIRRILELEMATAARINDVRRSYGLDALRISAELTQAARAHAEVLARGGFFAHEWSDGTPLDLWLARFYPAGNARFWNVGENLEWSAAPLDARQTVARWLADSGQRRNVLGWQWRQLGLGIISAEHAPGVYGGQNVVIVAAEVGVRR
jgi:uncharacterized protein YkwD